jgi:hypothetical protein
MLLPNEVKEQVWQQSEELAQLEVLIEMDGQTVFDFLRGFDHQYCHVMHRFHFPEKLDQ